MTAGGAGGRGRAPAPVTAPRRSRALPPGAPGGLGVLALLAALAVLAGACGAPGATPDAAPRSTTTGANAAPQLVPVEGGTATVALDDVPTTLNDHTLAGDTPVGRMLASAVWAQVFRVGPGLMPQLDTNVVDSAEVVSLQPQTVVYQIDPRAVWSDGVPISAADFTYAWQSQKGGAVDVDGTPDSVVSTLGYRDIDSLTASNGGKTVTVVFHTPFADWASLFDDLLPAHIAEVVGWNHGFDRFNPAVLVSGGPWQVVSWVPGSEIVLGRNPRWWGSPPTLDRIVVRAVSGDSALASALGGGQVQVAYPSGFDQSLMAQASSSPVLQSQVQLGTTMLQLEFNVRRAPLNVATVRQGIAHAIDRAALVESVGQPEDESVWEDNHHLFANGQPGYVDDAAGYEQADPAASARLLQQSGFVPDAHGSWTKDGKPVSLEHRVGGRRPLVGRGRPRRGGAARRGGFRRGGHTDADGAAVRDCAADRCVRPGGRPGAGRAHIPVRSPTSSRRRHR